MHHTTFPFIKKKISALDFTYVNMNKNSKSFSCLDIKRPTFLMST